MIRFSGKKKRICEFDFYWRKLWPLNWNVEHKWASQTNRAVTVTLWTNLRVCVCVCLYICQHVYQCSCVPKKEGLLVERCLTWLNHWSTEWFFGFCVSNMCGLMFALCHMEVCVCGILSAPVEKWCCSTGQVVCVWEQITFPGPFNLICDQVKAAFFI